MQQPSTLEQACTVLFDALDNNRILEDEDKKRFTCLLIKVNNWAFQRRDEVMEAAIHDSDIENY